jgi:cytochrome c biogenesis protein CcdA
MKEDPTLIDTLIERVKEFTLSYLELTKLKAINRLSQVFSETIPDALIVVLGLTFFLFLNLSAAFVIGDAIGQIWLGFLVVSGFYLLLSLVLHFVMRGWLRRTAGNYLVRKIFKSEKDV